MAKKRKPSSNSRLTTKAPTSAPMVIKAPTSTPVAPTPAPVVAAVTATPVAAPTPAPIAPMAPMATPVATTTAKSEILVDRHAIAQLAFARFVARGGVHGHALEDWLAAEAELTRAAQ
jgi:pyruvate dehydrogenase E2 component (dihydrolipoamide acetyltransferase)